MTINRRSLAAATLVHLVRGHNLELRLQCTLPNANAAGRAYMVGPGSSSSARWPPCSRCRRVADARRRGPPSILGVVTAPLRDDGGHAARGSLERGYAPSIAARSAPAPPTSPARRPRDCGARSGRSGGCRGQRPHRRRHHLRLGSPDAWSNRKPGAAVTPAKSAKGRFDPIGLGRFALLAVGRRRCDQLHVLAFGRGRQVLGARLSATFSRRYLRRARRAR